MLAGGGLQLNFTNTPGVSYTVLVSTNLTDAAGQLDHPRQSG